MSFLDKFKKKKTDEEIEKEVKEEKVEKKEEKRAEKKSEGKTEAPKLVPKKEKIVSKPNKDDTGNAYRVLVRPLLTEKITDLGALNQYAFVVHSRATKNEVKKAIRSLYGVEPIKINIVNMQGHQIRYGKNLGQTRNWKKAIITLKAGETIQVYEGV
jgi:large subunit ribosomal protein L23